MKDSSEQIWLTSVLTDTDVPNALILCSSLKRVRTSRKVGVIASPSVSIALREALDYSFDFVFCLQEDRNKVGMKSMDFVMLFVLTLTNFRKCVILAPNMLFLKNSDELFDWAEENDQQYAWTKEQDMSIVLIRPSLQEFNSVLQKFARIGDTELSMNQITTVLDVETQARKYIDGKFNRSLFNDVDMIIGNGDDVFIVNLPEQNSMEAAQESLGVVGQAVMRFWKRIRSKDVQPLLDASTKLAVTSLEDQKTAYNDDTIAIVGMSCRYPGANNLDEFWNILLNGKDATGKPPAFRWCKDTCGTQLKTEHMETNAGFLKCSVEDFDAKFFGLSPKEISCLDPQHRLLHELVWEALEDAAINPQSLEGTNGSIFIGTWKNDYKEILTRFGSEGFFRKYMGNSIGAGAARISHLLGLTGPSIATESGCSSSMVAVHLACKSLERGETGLALVCGVNLLLKSFDKEEMPMVLSSDGKCKTFDASANGFGRAEGGGVLVLKRVSDAVRDGDKIWALIRGSAMTQEGISKSLGTPTVECESLAMKRALQDARVDPAAVSYVEAHGTGTVVGDPMEVAAIAKAYHSKSRKEPLLIGSVKTNVGHTESCSGITGIMKVVLAMQQETIPPHRNFEKLNPAIELDAVPAKIPLETVSWPKQKGRPRLAGVSSFGITGTDAHAIIEEAPSTSEKNFTLNNFERPIQLLKITAKTEEALSILLERYKEHLNTSNVSFQNLTFTANSGRADFSHRAVVMAKSKEDAVKNIEQNKFFQGGVSTQGKICFLFTGQGSQYPGMAKQLYETSLVFRMHFEFCTKILKTKYNIDITQVLWSETSLAEISRTIYSQTSIFCVEYALLKLWESWGVQPDYVLGHSLGEFAAAVCAKLLGVEDALKLVAERSRLIDELPRGKMLVIKADKERVSKAMKEFIRNDDNEHLDIAAVNSTEQTVVAGDSELILKLSEYCNKSNLKCMVLASTHAFHSRHMDPMLESYRNVAKSVQIRRGSTCKFISGMRGTLVEGDHVDAEYWVEHTREKVLFLEASKKAVKLGCKTFIEIGPQPVLTALTMMNNENESHLLCLPSLKRNEDEWKTLLTTLSKLYVNGMGIDWKGFEGFYKRQKVALPHYPFVGKKYWPEMVGASGVSLHPLLGHAIPNASSTKLFQAGLNLSALEFIKDHAIGKNVIFPGAGFLEICLAAGVAVVEVSTDSLTVPTRPMKVENLRIEAPLCLQDTQTVQLQTVVEFNEAQGNWNDMKVNIFRRVDSEYRKWQPHASATFSPVPSAEEKELRFDIDSFKKTLQLPSRNEELTQFYHKVASIGLHFGPAFQSIEQIWRLESAQNVLLAKVKVPATDGQNYYILHPVVLDAMIQAVMILIHGSNIKKKLYVPIRIGKFVWLQKMNLSKDVYIQVSISTQVSALLVDSSGSVLAEMSSVELMDTTVKAIESVLEQQTSPLPDMWEEVWRGGLGPWQHALDLKTGADPKFHSDEFEPLMKSYNNPSLELTETFRELEQLSYLNILKALYHCGWEPELHQTLKIGELAEQLCIKADFRHYFRFMLETLEAEGILQLEIDGKSWSMKRIPPSLEQLTSTIESPLLSSKLSQKFQPVGLLSKLGQELSRILKGEQAALNTLFPKEATVEHPSLQNLYDEYQKVFLLAESFSVSNRQRLAQLRDSMKGQRFVLRILEVGAGTGSFSAPFLKCLEEEGIEFEYTYTDISTSFFPAAQTRFKRYEKQMKFSKLNIEEDPIQQGFSPEYYDFVYMAEVIHATRDIRESLGNIRMLMKPHAKMDMLESTRENRIITYIFGVLEGYWRFTDFNIRSRHCTISPQKWAAVFDETGFKVEHSFPILNAYQSHILVYKTEENIPTFLAPSKKTWIVFHEPGSPLSNFLIEKIQHSAMRKVISVTKGNNFKNDDGTRFELRSWEAEDYRRLMESISKLEVEGVLYCWTLNKMLSTQAEILQPYFYIAQSVLNYLRSKTRLIALTEKGAAAPLDGKGDLSQFRHSTLWGFTKSLKNENASLNCKCIEVDTPAGEGGMMEVFHEIWQADNEIQVAFQGATRYVPRFQRHKPASTPLTLPTGTDKFHLLLPQTKAIADVQFGPLSLGHLKSDHVEIQIKASALNFRDVLSIIKPSEEFRNSNTVGFDLAGVIKRVGSHVTKWREGDKVFGCNTHFTAFPNYVQLEQEVVLRVPENMSYFDAATIPAVYTTSILCLLNVAKIQKEDVVLLHTASGGVGLSAIEICKHVGCTIIATAGSTRKQNYLRSLGIPHVFHSRNTQFGVQILQLTNGKGVDVVLNSLTSPGFKEATLQVCAKNARFVEMSKLNIWDEEQVRKMRPDVKYSTVDVSTMEVGEWKRLFGVLGKLVQKNVVKAIPHVRFDGLDIKDALHYMQKAKHIGKIVCAMPELRMSSHSRELAMYTPFFNERATYLITGGLGGIGFVVCNWMVEKGARHVLLAGRSQPSSSTREKINQLNSQGANVTVVQLDVGNFEECRNLIENFIPKTGLPPLRGVMHAAGTLADGVILNQDWPRLSSTFRTKIDGTMNLHELTKYMNLEHFVMFSSTAARLGPPGQANHAAGNCFEDALTHYRQSMGLPATTINWGQWGEVGIATEMDLPGMKTISNLQGITALEYVLKTHRSQLTVVNVDSFVIFSKMLPYFSTYLDERIWKKAGVSVTSSKLSSQEFWEQYDSFSGVEAKRSVIKAQVQNILRNTLKLEENDRIGDDVELREMGVDSLMFVEIKNGLQTLLDNRLIVSTSALKDANTVKQLTSSIVCLLDGTQIAASKPTKEQVNQLIREDSQLPQEIRAKPGQIAVAAEDIETVLLTGSTGTLGPYLLKELTNLSQIKQVVCLIRPSKTTSAEERLRKLLREIGLLQNVVMEKIRCVTGNVVLPRLGLTNEDWEGLSGSVDAVVNCSANVLHTELYTSSTSTSDTRAVNIGGMKHLLQFACENKLKHYVHASSLIGVVTTDREGKLSEDWPELGDFDNMTLHSYPISKFVCDMLAKEAVERGIPCKVLRLPFIQGERNTGRIDADTNHLLLRYVFIMKSGCMPSSPLPILALPVDTCADVFVRLFLDKRAPPHVYNIGNDNPDKDQDFVSVAKRFGRNIKIVEDSEFHRRVREDHQNKALEMFRELYQDEDGFMALFSNDSISKWREGHDVYRNKRVTTYIPNFYTDQRPTMEYVYNDLKFLERKGWLTKFGL